MRFARLRWTLAASYALVTVLVLLTLGLVLAAGAAMHLRSGAALRATAESMRTVGAPRLAPFLDPVPDPAGLRYELQLYASGVDPQGQREQAESGSGLFTVGTGPPAGALVVLDAAGRRPLAATPGSAARLPPAAGTLVTAALGGATDPAQLAVRDGERNLVAVPITLGGGRVVGVLVGDFPLPVLTPSVVGAVAAAALAVAAPVAGLGVLFGLVTAHVITRRLRRLMTVSHAWGAGDLDVRVRDPSGDELGELARRLDSMADDLEALVRTRQAGAGAAAREAVARDLHDSVKQLVFAASLQVDAARGATGGDVDHHLARATEMLREAQHEVDHLLEPDLPADLPSVVRDHVRVWSERSGVDARVEVVGGGWSELGPRSGPALRRVVQEALANVAKHSGASRVDVVLARSEDDVVLTVTDDGRGPGPVARSSGRGLPGMRERMAALGGTATVEAVPGRGTRLTARCRA